MDLTRVAYNGRKTYRDKLTGNSWQPGDAKLVSADAGKKLLRFAEFAAAPGDATEGEKEQAMVVHKEAAREQDNERQQLESMLLTVESMDKGALESYARKYEVELDKRLGVAKLRAEVANLIEQFGVR